MADEDFLVDRRLLSDVGARGADWSKTKPPALPVDPSESARVWNLQEGALVSWTGPGPGITVEQVISFGASAPEQAHQQVLDTCLYISSGEGTERSFPHVRLQVETSGSTDLKTRQSTLLAQQECSGVFRFRSLRRSRL